MRATAPLPILAVGIAIGAVIAATAVLLMRTGTPDAPTPSRTETAAFRPPPSMSPPVCRVASQFTCTCGACDHEPLEQCDCPTAVEERAFIQEQLAAGLAEEEVAAAVDAKYGGRETNPSVATGPALSVNRDVAVTFATPENRAHIISHFRCPCDQCAIDSLADCECPHPGGAQEVKQFIDEAIAEKRYTVGEIVQKVEEKYGGRIR